LLHTIAFGKSGRGRAAAFDGVKKAPDEPRHRRDATIGILRIDWIADRDAFERRYCREYDLVVKRESEPLSPGCVGIGTQSRSRVAEVALQQSVPEGDVEIGAELAPERLNRGR
jgi:hypothetical protein